MKYLLILINSFLILTFYTLIFDNATLGLIVIILSYFTIHSNFSVDKRYEEFINELSTNEYRNMNEALEEFKESKNFLFGLFKKENNMIIEKFQQLITTHKEFDRFVEVQEEKIEFIKKSNKLRLKYYSLYILLFLLSFIPFIYLRYNNLYFYYHLFTGGYYKIFLLSLVLIIINNYNLYYLNKKNKKDLEFFDNYSLCFHKNCLTLLNIEDNRLKFDNKGMCEKIELLDHEDSKINYLSIIPLISSLVLSYIFII